jgi:hypothetical protein
MKVTFKFDDSISHAVSVLGKFGFRGAPVLNAVRRQYRTVLSLFRERFSRIGVAPYYTVPVVFSLVAVLQVMY